jgi:hypothetical protein
VRARAGETVRIPGSVGTVSHVAEGLGNPQAFPGAVVPADTARAVRSQFGSL